MTEEARVRLDTTELERARREFELSARAADGARRRPRQRGESAAERRDLFRGASGRVRARGEPAEVSAVPEALSAGVRKFGSDLASRVRIVAAASIGVLVLRQALEGRTGRQIIGDIARTVLGTLLIEQIPMLLGRFREEILGVRGAAFRRDLIDRLESERAIQDLEARLKDEPTLQKAASEAGVDEFNEHLDQEVRRLRDGAERFR